MTKEDIEKIKGAIQRAESYIASIEAIENADPYRAGVVCRLFERDNNMPLLPDDLLKRVIATGRMRLLDDLKSELASLTIKTGEKGGDST